MSGTGAAPMGYRHSTQGSFAENGSHAVAADSLGHQDDDDDMPTTLYDSNEPVAWAYSAV